ncbi:hypothetical protein OSB04_031490 [Centaurea solstitialis]|uniref:DUF4216 domain-containing protein n=1 Tax=Centaurea solstitialis TaxID=347529 RepID=A0AA38VXM6_9ASTR|nr:hypothetical protein OSB04_031490 [Centaurea solstitialis]
MEKTNLPPLTIRKRPGSYAEFLCDFFLATINWGSLKGYVLKGQRKDTRIRLRWSSNSAHKRMFLGDVGYERANLTDDSFVLASQVDKVFYVRDPKHKDWEVVRHVKLRDVFDMGIVDDDHVARYSNDSTFDVPNLDRIARDVDDGIDITPDMKRGVDVEEDDDDLTPERQPVETHETTKTQGGQSSSQGHHAIETEDDQSSPYEISSNEEVWKVGGEGNELVQYIGTLVRMPDHVSIAYTDWRKVPMERKKICIHLLRYKSIIKIDMSKFVIHQSETDEIKKWIFHNMGNKWRTWKGSLKAVHMIQALVLMKLWHNKLKVTIESIQLSLRNFYSLVRSRISGFRDLKLEMESSDGSNGSQYVLKGQRKDTLMRLRWSSNSAHKRMFWEMLVMNVKGSFFNTSQVDKVFYVRDPKHKDWEVVRHVKLRDVFDIGIVDDDHVARYSNDSRFDVPNLDRIARDVDDGIDITPDMKRGVDVEEDDDDSTPERQPVETHETTKTQGGQSSSQGHHAIETEDDQSSPYEISSNKEGARKKYFYFLYFLTNEWGLRVWKVGGEGNELVQYIGTLVRMPDHVSIAYTDWRKVPMERKKICIHLLSPSLLFIKVKQMRLRNGSYITWGINGGRGKVH